MTKQLEETLNLPHLEDALKDSEPEAEMSPEAAAALAGLQQALQTKKPSLPDLTDDRDHSDSLEEIYQETLKHSRDLMDLGFNVDLRSARGIFEVAASMFKNTIDAKNSKRDMQLKQMKLAIEERKLRLAERQFTGDDTQIVENAQVITMDRNELIRQAQDRIKGKK